MLLYPVLGRLNVLSLWRSVRSLSATTLLHSPTMRWFLLALSLNILALLFMLLPATSPLISGTSRLLGGSELTDAFGHVILLAVLTGTWYSAFQGRLGKLRALAAAALLVLCLGLMTEFAQAGIADRGARLLDVGANVLGVALAVIYIGLKTS